MDKTIQVSESIKIEYFNDSETDLYIVDLTDGERVLVESYELDALIETLQKIKDEIKKVSNEN